ncbi:MAG TPA: hypothetical protein VII06_05315 [Chloroflexota bacterium]|jgi:hypothetical protein
MVEENEWEDAEEDERPLPVWDIRREGRAWGPGEALPRLELAPEKMEMLGGKLFWSDRERLTMLGLLLEQMGMDAAVRLGDPRLWRAAVADLPDSPDPSAPAPG